MGDKDGEVTFAPQRLYPRFAGAAEQASRVPGGLRLLGCLRGLASDRQRTTGDRWPDSCSPLAVVGFPRTGSTFLTTAASMWSGAPIPHLHDPHVIPRLGRAGTPVLVPVRPPRDTVLSWSIYNGDDGSAERLRQRMETYVAWHREVLRLARAHPVIFSLFDDFTADPSTPLQRVLGHTHPPITAESVLSVLAAEQHDLDWTASTMPSEQRARQRARFEASFADPRVQCSLTDAQELYASARQQTGGHESVKAHAQRSA